MLTIEPALPPEVLQPYVDELSGLASASELSASAFVERLQAYALRSRVAGHPLLHAIADGDFVDLAGSIRRFLAQYYFYSHRFTRYLAAVTANLESPEHRAALVGNSAEEAGHIDEHHRQELRAAGIDPDHVAAPHPELYRRFLVAIGLDAVKLLQRTPHLATAAWVETMEEIFRHSGQEQAIGALGIATEGIVRPMYQKLVSGIERAWPGLAPRDRAFFDLHAAVDDDHADVMRGIAVALSSSAAARRHIATGVLRALSAREHFYDEMLRFLRQTDSQGAGASDAGPSGSATFTDMRANRNSLEPVPAETPTGACLHAGVVRGATTPFSTERHHPVFPVELPSRAVSMSIGELAPGGRTSNHRHAYEALVYVVRGRGHSMIEGQRFEWQEGDALYTPPWCWHQHFASDAGPVQYLTATNMPLLGAIGQTVIRQEAPR